MKFAQWIKAPGGVTPGGTPAYVCSVCGGSEHLYGAEFPKRKMVCDKCGCVNHYPWEKILDQDSGTACKWIPIREALPPNNAECFVCSSQGAVRTARAHVITSAGSNLKNCWWTFVGYVPQKMLDIVPAYWMFGPELPEGITRKGLIDGIPRNHKQEKNHETFSDDSED